LAVVHHVCPGEPQGDPALTDQPVLAFQVALQRGSAGVVLDTIELDEPPFLRVR